MSKNKECQHTEADKDTAIFDGMCPLCLADQVKELQAANKKLQRQVAQAANETEQGQEIAQLRAQLEQAKGTVHNQSITLEAYRQMVEQMQAENDRAAGLASELNQLNQAMATHPRAAKLLRKGKGFVVVAEDEPYYIDVYLFIKIHELAKGSWTEEDEQRYQAARAAHGHGWQTGGEG